MALASLEEVKAALGITDANRDAQITALLEPLSAVVETYAGRAFSSAQVTEDHEGGVATLVVRRHPITGTPTITDQWTGEQAAEADFEVIAEYGMIRRLPFGSFWSGSAVPSPFDGDGFTPAPRALPRWRVTYTGGPASAPEDAKAALYEAMAANLTSQGGKQAERDGDYAVTFATVGALPASARQMLERYRASPI